MSIIKLGLLFEVVLVFTVTKNINDLSESEFPLTIQCHACMIIQCGSR